MPNAGFIKERIDIRPGCRSGYSLKEIMGVKKFEPLLNAGQQVNPAPQDFPK
jgi:hypothetical protein